MLFIMWSFFISFHISHNTWKIFCGKGTFKAEAGGYCKYVAGCCCQFADFFFESEAKEIPDDKTSTDLLQKWIKINFEDLVFEEADDGKDYNSSSLLVTGRRDVFATPQFARVSPNSE